MQTIDITTTQNVTIEYELASLRERIFAFFVDATIVVVAYLILISALISGLGTILTESSITMYVVFSLFPIVLFMAYQFLSESLANGQSWGKKAMNLKVVRLDGREPSFSDYLLRAIFHIVDTLTSGGVIAALLISSSVKNQRLGDLTANTTVIKVKSNIRFRLEDILNINTIEDYEPTYLAVKQLSEQDMLLIKTAVTRYQTYKNHSHGMVVSELATKLEQQLEITAHTKNKVEFLKTLIRDYIVLTR